MVITAERWRKIQIEVRTHLKRRPPEDLEDCAQYVAMRDMLVNGSGSLRCFVMDWCRENGLSMKRPRKGAVALGGARSHREFEEANHGRYFEPMEGLVASDVAKLMTAARLGRETEALRRYYAGETLKEIADSFGVSEAYVGFIRDRGLHRIRKAFGIVPESVRPSKRKNNRRSKPNSTGGNGNAA